jgi:Flp pilus assembly pilin Flp
MNVLKRFWADESGQGLGEYTVLISLITLGVMLMLRPFREAILGVLTKVTETLNTGASA